MQGLGEGIWLIDGSTVDVAGFKYSTRMAVIRLENGELVLWSPIELTAQITESVKSLGEVAHLVAPNSFHHIFLRDWLRAFPKANLYAPASFSERHNQVYVDTVIEDFDFNGEIKSFCYPTAMTDEAVLYHTKSKTIIFTDVLQNLPAKTFKGWRKWAAQLDLMTTGMPAVPRKFRLATRRKRARQVIQEMLENPIENIVIAHGECVFGNGRAHLFEAFKWLGISAR